MKYSHITFRGMMRLLNILAFIVLSFVAKGQIFIKPNNSYGVIYNRVKTDSGFYVPVRDTDFVPDRVGSMAVRPQDSLLYIAISTFKRPYWSNIGKAYTNSLITTGFSSPNYRQDSIELYHIDVTKTLGNNGWDTTATNWKINVTQSIVSDGILINQPADISATNYVSCPVKISPLDGTTMMQIRLVSQGSHFYAGIWQRGTSLYFQRWNWGAVNSTGGEVIQTDARGFPIGYNSMAPPQNGDIIRIYFRRSFAKFYLTVHNLTQNTVVTSIQDDALIGENVNDYNPGIFLLTGSVVLQDFRVYANNYRPDIEWIGASIVQGTNSSPVYDSSYTGRIQYKTNLKTSLSGGSGDGLLDVRDRIVSILKMKPRMVAIGDMGVNDILNGRTYAQWQADYKWLVDTLHHEGIFVIIQNQTPASGFSYPDSINAWQARTFVNNSNTYLMHWANNTFNSTYEADTKGHFTLAGSELYSNDFVSQINNFIRAGSASTGILGNVQYSDGSGNFQSTNNINISGGVLSIANNDLSQSNTSAGITGTNWLHGDRFISTIVNGSVGSEITSNSTFLRIGSGSSDFGNISGTATYNRIYFDQSAGITISSQAPYGNKIILSAGTINIPTLGGHGTGVVGLDNLGNLSYSAGGGTVGNDSMVIRPNPGALKFYRASGSGLPDTLVLLQVSPTDSGFVVPAQKSDWDTAKADNITSGVVVSGNLYLITRSGKYLSPIALPGGGSLGIQANGGTVFTNSQVNFTDGNNTAYANPTTGGGVTGVTVNIKYDKTYDFDNNGNQIPLVISAGGGGVSSNVTPQLAGHIGSIGISFGAGTTAQMYCVTQNNSLWIDSATQITSRVRFNGLNFSLASVNNANMFELGFINSAQTVNTLFTNGCAFVGSDSLNSGNWMLKCGQGGTYTTVNTSTAMDNGNVHSYEVVIYKYTAKFYYDGVQIGSTISTNIPQGKFQTMTAGFNAFKQSGTGDGSISIDQMRTSGHIE